MAAAWGWQAMEEEGERDKKDELVLRKEFIHSPRGAGLVGASRGGTWTPRASVGNVPSDA